MVEANQEFIDFLKNPSKYELTDNDRDILEDVPSYELESSLSFIFWHDGEGICSIGGYYNGDFYLTDMNCNPEGRGYGRKTMQYMSEQLKSVGIDIVVADIIDEAKKFWKKMEKEGYVQL